MAKLGPCTVITRNKGGTASPRKIMNITQDRFTGDISHSVVNAKIFLVSTEKLYYGDVFCFHKLFNISAHVSCLNDNISLPFARISFENFLKNMIERASNFIVQPHFFFFFVAAWRRVVANMKYANRNFVRLKNTCLGIFLKKRIKI